MTSGRNRSLNKSALYIQPNRFIDYLSIQLEAPSQPFSIENYVLFVDIDGTLAPFTLNPKDSIIPPTTLALLQDLQDCGVKIAAITGRSLGEAKQMLSPLSLPIAATHGLEIALEDSADSPDSIVSAVQVDIAKLSKIKQAITQACTPYSDLTIEDKPYSVALHYRQNPDLEDVASTIMSTALERYPDWLLKQGKYVWEIMPKGADKGTAILALLEKMQTSYALFPIFIGDDITDEVGFAAVQGIGGMGIKVGTEPTCAHYYVNDIDEVTMLLKSFLAFCQSHVSVHSNFYQLHPNLAKNHYILSSKHRGK
ncbi:trehalose-phosphatase [uncultured Psychrobacter sp.]|uniref:trehalose-phosphatase n=1 Tax=uncultured Psychrobacter sp. TaxID=259303 RepID=UPI003457A182